MFSTVALCLMVLSVTRNRGFSGVLKAERTGLERDTNFFILALGLATSVLFVPHLGVSALLLSLLIIPIATELTEKADNVEKLLHAVTTKFLGIFSRAR